MLLYLDYLKFLAIFAVIAFHIHDTISFDSPWFSGGYLGVDVFLFLSGFLVERSLAKAVTGSWGQKAKAFFTRRFSRILLPMWVTTLAIAVFCQVTGVVPDIWGPAFWSTILGYNFYLVFHHIPYFQIYSTPHPFLGMWFIALLGQLTLAHFLLRSLSPWRWIWRGLLTLLFLASLLLAIHWLHQDALNMAYVLPSHGFPYWAGVGMAAMGWGGRREGQGGQRHWDILALLGVAVLCGLLVLAPWEGFVWYSLAVTLLTAGILLSAARGQWLPDWRVPLLGSLGEMSYSLYLWNVPAVAFVHFFFHAAPLTAQIGLAVTVVLALAILTYLGLEIPIQSAFGRNRRHGVAVQGYLLVLVLLLVGIWGWGEANRAWVAWSDVYAKNQHDSLYQQYLERQNQRLTQDLKALAHAPNLQAAERRAGDVAAATHEAHSESDLLQWQPHPAFGFLYNNQEIRQNRAYPQKQVLFITDSILLGWSGYVIHMVPNGILNGRVGRSFFRALPVLQQMLAQPGTQQVRYLVVELGSNGYVPWPDLEQFIRAAGDRKIMLIIPSVPRPWEGEVTSVYLRAAAKYPNVTLLPWNSISQGHAGYFVADQVHLTWDGAQALMQAVLRQLYVMGYRTPSGPAVASVPPAGDRITAPTVSPASTAPTSSSVVASSRPARSGTSSGAGAVLPSPGSTFAAEAGAATPTSSAASEHTATLPMVTQSVKPLKIAPATPSVPGG